MNGFQRGDPLGVRQIVWSVRIVRAQQEVKTVKTVMAVEAPSTCDRQMTAKSPPKDRQKTTKSSEIPCFTRFRSCQSLRHFRVQDGADMQRRCCIYARCPAKPRDPWKPSKSQWCWGGWEHLCHSPYTSAGDGAWNWKWPWPQAKTEQKLNQKWRVSKTAFKKTAFRRFR